jgi:hypothetical protein
VSIVDNFTGEGCGISRIANKKTRSVSVYGI